MGDKPDEEVAKGAFEGIAPWRDAPEEFAKRDGKKTQNKKPQKEHLFRSLDFRYILVHNKITFPHIYHQPKKTHPSICPRSEPTTRRKVGIRNNQATSETATKTKKVILVLSDDPGCNFFAAT